MAPGRERRFHALPVVRLAAVIVVTAALSCDSVNDHYELNVIRDGPGHVSSIPNGISCGEDCAARYPAGTTVFLEATGDEAVALRAWAGGCEPDSESDACKVMMDRDKTVYAYFSVNSIPVPLVVDKDGSGTGTVASEPEGIYCGDTCSSTFGYGEEVTLTAEPDQGSSFAGWTGAECSGTGRCTFSLTAETSITATFSKVPPGERNLKVTKDGDGNGSVISDPEGINCGPECNANFVEGTEVTLVAEADANSELADWNGCYQIDESSCTVAMTEHRVATAVFTPLPAVKSVSVTPGEVTLNSGEQAELEATVHAVGDVDKSVEWHSHDVTIASVDATGIVQAESPGVTKVTATSTFDPDKRDTATVSVTSEPDDPRLVPHDTTCNGAQVDERCAVDIHLKDYSGNADAFELSIEVDGFTLAEASRGDLLSDGCLVGHGPEKVVAVCDEPFSGGGALITVTLERAESYATAVTVKDAYLAIDSSTKIPVEGGSLPITASD